MATERGGNLPSGSLRGALARAGGALGAGVRALWRREAAADLRERRESDGSSRRSGISRDVAEPKGQEGQPSGQESILRGILESAAAPIFSVDRDYRYTSFNSAHGAVMRSLYGTEPSLGVSLLDCVTVEEDRRQARANLDRALAGDRFAVEELTGDPARARTCFEISHNPVRLAGGPVVGAAVFAADVSVRWRAEEALRESEEKYRRIVETAIEGVIYLDRDARMTFVNQQMASMLGSSIGEMLGQKFESFLAQDQLAGHRAQMALRAQGKSAVYERSLRKRDGGTHWALISARAILDSEGNLEGSFAMLTDITERKRAEDALKESERELREAQAIAGLGSYVLDVGAGRWKSSETLDAIFGIGPEWDRSVGGWGVLVHPDEREALTLYLAGEVLGKGVRFDREYRIVRPEDGRERWVHGLGEVTLGPDGNATRLAGTIMDVTERRIAAERIRGINEELERRVAERTAQLTEALRELESFAYTIAHDLKAPLRAIDGYAALLEQDHADRLDEEARGFLGKVRKGAVTMGQLIADLLEYSRLERRDMRKESIDVDALVRGVVASRDEAIRESGAAVRVVAGGVRATVDPAGLEMALRNLFDNALKFHRAGRPAEVTVTTSSSAGRTVVSVRDEGIGFDMKYNDRVFELFQRLGRSEEHAGTGVGLALVRRAVERMGGTVRAQSAPGAGATFTVELPT